MGLSLVALVSAQPGRRQGWGGAFPPPMAPETVTITGTLGIVQGDLAVQQNGVTYHVYGLNRYIGFIDSLKDGARVTLEGSAFSVSSDDKTKYLRVTKLTLNGKEYDLARPASTTGFPGMGPR